VNRLFPDGYQTILWGFSEHELKSTLADVVKTPQLADDAATQSVRAWLDQTHALGRMVSGLAHCHSDGHRPGTGHHRRWSRVALVGEESPAGGDIVRMGATTNLRSVPGLPSSAGNGDTPRFTPPDLLSFCAPGFGVREADYAVSALAWCWTLPKLAAVVSSDAWWSLLNHLIRAAMEAAAGNRLPEDVPWLEQMLAGELSLSLAYLFPELARCRALRAAARKTLSAGLLDLLDEEGLPHARQIPQLRRLSGSWTRCRMIADRMQRACWTAEAESQYRRFVHSALRLARRDGSHAFSRRPATTADRKLLKTAVHVGGNAAARAVAAIAWTRGVAPGKKKGRRRAGPPLSAMHSEWAAAAVLRRKRWPSSPALTVLFPDAACRTEFACGNDVLWSGTWEFEVHIDGALASASDEWRENCWLSNGDMHYLELEMQLDAGLRVERHMLLARRDRFLLLADAVLGSRPAALRYRGRLPLCDGIRFRQACETREGLLLGRKPRARVLPLALAEWQADRRPGHLRQTTGGLELRQAAEGRSLFAPLFFDFDRSRMNKPVTWRQLTVGQSLRAQPADVAVGYRATVGKRHWLIYRAPAGAANRTVLGHNLTTEFLAARVTRRGAIKPLVEIE
jgi:hypothetical protein